MRRWLCKIDLITDSSSMLYVSQYGTCIHRAGKYVHTRLLDSEGKEIPVICPNPEKSFNLQSTCSWDANIVSCTWGQEDMLCYYKAFFPPIIPPAALFICPPPKKGCPKRASSVVVAVFPHPAPPFQFLFPLLSPLSSCLTGRHNHLINIYPTDTQQRTHAPT